MKINLFGLGIISSKTSSSALGYFCKQELISSLPGWGSQFMNKFQTAINFAHAVFTGTEFKIVLWFSSILTQEINTISDLFEYFFCFWSGLFTVNMTFKIVGALSQFAKRAVVQKTLSRKFYWCDELGKWFLKTVQFSVINSHSLHLRATWSFLHRLTFIFSH